MAQTKATKKFEKRHLKDTLERRKGLKKIKQKQQLKARKKSRRAEENGVDSNGADDAAKTKKKDSFKGMSVDDFFQGGFEIPELPKKTGSKRKRQEEAEEEDESDASEESFEQAPPPHDSEDESEDEEDFADHKQHLDALAQNDPEFHKYLQENEPELLDADLDEMEGLSDSDEEDEPKKKKAKKGEDNELTKATVQKWETALTTQHSLRAAKEVVLAFRAAAHVSDDDDEQKFKYSISDPDVYHLLLKQALTRIPEIFAHHLPVQENQKTGKLHVSTESKKFKTLAPLLRSQVGSIQHLLSHLSDAATLRLTLDSTAPLLPYLLSFKKLVRDLAKAITTIWSSSSNTESTRIAAFLLLRRLTVLGDPGIRENVLKSVYQGLVSGARNTTVHTLPGVNLMKNSASELWGIDTQVGYTTAFTFIRQLAIHLRQTIQNTTKTKDGYKVVYNWQYTHSLDFWSRVLSAHCVAPDAPLRPLIYPLVQVTLGALRLIPTPTYFPLRFHLTRSLLRLAKATNTYIPLAAPLYEVLNSAEMRKAPISGTLKPLDFESAIRAPKSYLRTRVYQDGVGEQVQELLAEFLGGWSKSIAFPELALLITITLKRWLRDANSRVQGKGNKNQKVNNMISVLVQKVEANAKWIEEKRAKVDFAPDRRREVEGFLAEVEWEKSPLGAFVVGLRRGREERGKVEMEAREEERRREERDRKKKIKDREKEVDVDSEESEDEDGDEEMSD